MRVLILGGSGFVGTALSYQLAQKGHTVFIGTRQKNTPISSGALSCLNSVYWTPEAPAAVADLDAIVNLAGAPINRFRWTAKNKALIYNSRMRTTEALAKAVNSGFYTPKVVVNGSAMGIYGNQADQLLSEADVPHQSTSFLAKTAADWETAALPMAASTRLVLLRTAVVLGHGGALSVMKRPYQYGVGGPLGNGQQWFSWIHLHDLVALIEHALLNDAVVGPINACAPEPVTQNQFSRSLAKSLHRPNVFRLPEALLRLLLGEMSEVVLHSQRGSCEKVLKSGFDFQFPNLNQALQDLL